jgi:hypothetical protein
MGYQEMHGTDSSESTPSLQLTKKGMAAIDRANRRLIRHPPVAGQQNRSLSYKLGSLYGRTDLLGRILLSPLVVLVHLAGVLAYVLKRILVVIGILVIIALILGLIGVFLKGY